MSEMIILLKELSCDFYSKPDEEIIFKGMRMGPIIDFGNESEETIDYKCHFCSNENLTRESLIISSMMVLFLSTFATYAKLSFILIIELVMD
jgi:hypothetical protein